MLGPQEEQWGLGGALRDSASFPLPMEETKVVTTSGEGKQGALLTSSHDRVR